MNKWIEFIDKISDSEFEQIFKDYDLFEKQGFIGECVLREKAEKWQEIIFCQGSVTKIMYDIAFEGYRKFYQRQVKL